MTTKEYDTYERLNDVLIGKIELISDNGSTLNVTDIIKHISIYEDLKKPYLSGYVYVQDAMNISQHLPINGHETLLIDFKTPGIENSEFVTLKFDVFSITDRVRTKNDRGEMYKLNFSSPIQKINEQVRINKNFKGCCSCVVSQLISNVFPQDTQCTIEKTSADTFDFVIPNLKPLDAIEFISKRAISFNPPHNTNYMHYATIHGQTFVSLGLLAKGPTQRNYEMRTSGYYGDNLLKQRFNIQDFELIGDFNRSEDASNGLYLSTLVTHDITTKQIKTYRQGYSESSSDSINEHSILPRTSKWTKVSVRDMGLDHIGPTYFRPKQLYAFTSDMGQPIPDNTSPNWYYKENGQYFYSDGGKLLDQSDENLDIILQNENNPNNFNPEKYLLNNKMTSGLLGNTRVNIRVAGDSTLQTGMIVDIKIPSNEPLNKDDVEWWDKYYSGKYMITAIRHSIDNTTGGGYTTCLELSRDSLPTQIPDKKNLDLGEGYNESGWRRVEELQQGNWLGI